MSRFSLLIFSRNDVKKALELIRDMGSLPSEIVVVDASDNEQHTLLLAQKKRLRNLRVYKAIALGYPDPLRMYGLGKCRNDWVFLLDTDERINDRLKSDLKKIIDSGADAYAIRRHEHEKPPNKETFLTWQIRLFKKSKVVFRGLLHEQPIVKGRLESLNDSYYIDHQHQFHGTELRSATGPQYSKISMFDRMSYKMYNEQMLEYLGRFLVKEDSDMRKTASGKSLSALMTIYEKASLKKPDAELSDFDYYMYHLYKTVGYEVTGRGLRTLFAIPEESHQYMEYMRSLKNGPDGAEDFEISKTIHERGITSFLGLDKESRIKELNKEYSGKEQGITLLIHLLKEAYRRRR